MGCPARGNPPPTHKECNPAGRRPEWLREWVFIEFIIKIWLPYESGGNIDPAVISPEILYGETMDDHELKERILGGTVPLDGSICKLVNQQ